MSPRYRIFHCGYWDLYSLMSLNPYNKSLLRSTELLARDLQLEEGMKVLDAGCGWGGNAVWLAENYKVFVEGITLSPVQIEMAKRIAEKRKVDKLVDFRVGNFLNTDFPDNEFDRIYQQEAVCHVPNDNTKDVFKEFWRILKPGGILGQQVCFRYHRNLTEKEEQSFMKALDLGGVPDYLTLAELIQVMDAIGFISTKKPRDLRKNISPSIIPSYIILSVLLNLLKSVRRIPVGRFLPGLAKGIDDLYETLDQQVFMWKSFVDKLWSNAFLFHRKEV